MATPAQPVGQGGGDDLDPVPASGGTPAGQQFVGAPAVGAAGPPRGQARPPAVEQGHHSGPGRAPTAQAGPDAQDAGRQPPRGQVGVHSLRVQVQQHAGTAFGVMPGRLLTSPGRGRGSSCCTLSDE